MANADGEKYVHAIHFVPKKQSFKKDQCIYLKRRVTEEAERDLKRHRDVPSVDLLPQMATITGAVPG